MRKIFYLSEVKKIVNPNTTNHNIAPPYHQGHQLSRIREDEENNIAKAVEMFAPMFGPFRATMPAMGGLLW